MVCRCVLLVADFLKDKMGEKTIKRGIVAKTTNQNIYRLGEGFLLTVATT